MTPKIDAAHILLYSKDPAADRVFFRDVLGLHSVDAGRGWLIFALPPAEAAFHPIENGADFRRHSERDLLGAVLYLMCDDLQGFVSSLAAKNVNCTAITEEPWGIKTTVILPSGGELGLYQPKHPTAYSK